MKLSLIHREDLLADFDSWLLAVDRVLDRAELGKEILITVNRYADSILMFKFWYGDSILKFGLPPYFLTRCIPGKSRFKLGLGNGSAYSFTYWNVSIPPGTFINESTRDGEFDPGLGIIVVEGGNSLNYEPPLQMLKLLRDRQAEFRELLRELCEVPPVFYRRVSSVVI